MIEIFHFISNLVLILLFFGFLLTIISDIIFRIFKFKKLTKGTTVIIKYIKDNKHMFEIVVAIATALTAIKYIIDNLNININN